MSNKTVNSLNFSEIKEVCRLCLASTDNRIDIYGKVGLLTNITEIVYNLFNLQLLQNALWPQSICIPCFQKLIEFNDFRSIVWNTEATLLNKLSGKDSSSTAIVEHGENLPIKKDADDCEVQDDDSESLVDLTENDVFEEVPKEPEISIDIPEKRNLNAKQTYGEEKEQAGTSRMLHNLNANEKISQEADIAKFIDLNCDLCSMPFGTFSNLRKHFNLQHNQEGYVKCCNLTIKSKSKLNEHVEYHKNPTKYECKECGKFFKLRRVLNEHMKKHIPNEERQFNCEQCPKKCTSLFLLKIHLNSHIPREKWEHFCPHCQKAFSSAYAMRSHVKIIHERSQKRVCEICAKIFYCLESFKSHNLKHQGNNPTMECALCGKSFTDRRLFMQHQRRKHYPKLGKFVCDICGKEYTKNILLRGHKAYAHREKIFKCNLCEKEFKHAINLKEHMATHTGQQTLYTCNFCDKKFNSNANRYSHQKKMHPKEWEEDRQKKLNKKL